MADRVWVFDCRGRDVPPVMVVHARCLEIAVREANHRFEKIWPRKEFPGAWVDLSSGREEEDRGYLFVQ